MFYDYTIKDYMEICYLLLRPETPVERFMWKFDLSRYEYNMCKQRLGEMERFYGITLEFGEEIISWQVTDREKYLACQKNCWTFYNKHRHGYLSDEEFARGLYIVKRLLLAEDCTNLEELTEEMGFSRSTMRGALKLARSFLNSYSIRLENVPHYGVRPVGNELDLRRSLVAVYNFLDVNVIPETDSSQIAEGLASGSYGKIRILLRKFLREHNSAIAQGRIRKLAFFAVIQNVRIQSGHGFEQFRGVDPAVLEHLDSDLRLKQLSRELLDKLEKELGYGPYDQAETRAMAFMLLETFADEQGLCALVEKAYRRVFRGLQKELLDYLDEACGIRPEGLYSQLLDGVLREVVVSHGMGILGEKGTGMDGRTPMISDYPLIGHLYMRVQRILTQYFGTQVAGQSCTSVCEFVGFYIQSMINASPHLRIGVAVRQALYKPELILGILKERLDPRYYSTLESCRYEELLEDPEETGRRYDVVICDQRLSNDRIFLSFAEFHENFDHLNHHLRMMRDLCAGLLRGEDIVVRDLDLQSEEDRRALEEQIRRYAPNAGVWQPDIQEEEANNQGCLVEIFPDREAEHNLLRMGMLKKKYKKRFSRYIIYAGRIDRENIKLLNMLLHELTRDPLFWDTMLQAPTPETINDQLNPLL